MTRSDIDLLARLVAFDTTSRNSNLPLLDWVETYLAGFGLKGVRSYEPTGAKANLWVTIGPAEVPGYILSGHTDVVPVDGQTWTSDPFTLTERDGKLYGRGACDMKGFLAAVLAKVPDMVAAPLARPIHLVFSHDEEVGCIGVRYSLAEVDRIVATKPIASFVGEPTGMQVVIAHKSKTSYRVDVTGKASHSSRAPEGVNAIDYAARLIVKIREIANRLAAAGMRDALYDIPHSTAHTGTISGGAALNIVPDFCTFQFEFRMLPGEDHAPYEAEIRALAAELEAEMHRVDPTTGIVIDAYNDQPGFEVANDSAIVRLAGRLAGRNDAAKVAYATEAGLFVSMADIPSVVVGPGDIGQAHRPDEFIKISELDRCATFLDRLIAEARHPV
jgi:acetylornithine deacetylase